MSTEDELQRAMIRFEMIESLTADRDALSPMQLMDRLGTIGFLAHLGREALAPDKPQEATA